MNKRKKAWFLTGCIFFLILAIMVVFGTFVGEKSEEVEEEFENRGLARINIELNGITIDDIYKYGKDIKYPNNKLDLYDGGQKYQYNDVEIKGRGNSTLAYPKKSYQIKFRTRTDLLGLGQTKKWVLLANYIDASQVRNDIAFNVAEMVEAEYNSRGSFVEVYINGEYLGVYYLVEKIEISKGSVALKDENGVLMELNTLRKNYETCYTSYLGNCLVLKDAISKDNDKKNIAVEKFLNDFNRLEMWAERGNYSMVSDLIDIDSFAKYFLVSEFSSNPDAYASSFYFYKDGDSDKIHAGPVWDFDFAFGNRRWVWQVDNDIFSPEKIMVRKKEAFGLGGIEEDKNISKLLYYLAEMPEFENKVREIFQAKMSGKKEELIVEIERVLKQIEEAVKQDNQRWGIDGFDKDSIDLVEWVKRRYDFFEQRYGL